MMAVMGVLSNVLGPGKLNLQSLDQWRVGEAALTFS